MVLSKTEIEQIRPDWLGSRVSLCPFVKEMTEFESDIYQPLREHTQKLRDYRVIEIGPGRVPITDYWACKEYIGVEPNIPLAEMDNYVEEDGLTFLKKQKDSSAVIVSIGVLDEDVLCPFFSIRGGDTSLHQKYIGELIEEIKRVSYPFSILIGSDVVKYFGDPEIFGGDFHDGGIYSFNK